LFQRKISPDPVLEQVVITTVFADIIGNLWLHFVVNALDVSNQQNC
jgi:hypothetical protein